MEEIHFPSKAKDSTKKSEILVNVAAVAYAPYEISILCLDLLTASDKWVIPGIGIESFSRSTILTLIRGRESRSIFTSDQGITNGMSYGPLSNGINY